MGQGHVSHLERPVSYGCGEASECIVLVRYRYRYRGSVWYSVLLVSPTVRW